MSTTSKEERRAQRAAAAATTRYLLSLIGKPVASAQPAAIPQPCA